jgi:hypothetical protein
MSIFKKGTKFALRERWLKELIVTLLENRFQLVTFVLQVLLFFFTIWVLIEMLALLRLLLKT